VRDKIDNKNSVKKFILIVVFFVLVFIINFILKIEKYNQDYLMAVLAEDGIALINVSFERKVVNVLKINNNVNIWYGGGTGWNSHERVKKMFSNKKDVDQVLFYNFGFIPEKILELKSIADWKNSSTLVTSMGSGRFLYFSILRDDMIFNTETITTKLEQNIEKFSEIMIRDFVSSDKYETDNEIKISIVNMTQENGLAGFLGSRIEWMGGLVVSLGNEKRNLEDVCVLEKSENMSENWWLDRLRYLFGCKEEINNSLSDDQIELYFGDKFAEMIKYSSYVRTF